jgi:hypothetical protein
VETLPSTFGRFEQEQFHQVDDVLVDPAGEVGAVHPEHTHIPAAVRGPPRSPGSVRHHASFTAQILECVLRMVEVPLELY